MEFSFKQGDQEWKRLRQKALSNLYWFCDVVLGYGPLIPMRPSTHYAFCKVLSRQTGEPEIDEAPMRLFLMPRELGKTTIGTQGYTLWRLIQDPTRSLLLANEKEDNAKKFLMSIKREIEGNSLFRALFPEILPPDYNKTRWSATEFDLERATNRKEPSCFVTGVGGTVTGMHPDEIVADDIISGEAMRNAKVGARQIMEAANDWTHQLWALVNKNASNHGVTFIGTHWWYGDTYDHVENYFGNGESPREYMVTMKLPDSGVMQRLPVTRVGDLLIFKRSAIEDGRSIFPEKWDLERLAKMRMADPVLFSCNYMNQPSDDVTADFKEPWLKTYEWVGSDRVRFLDNGAKERVLSISDLDRIGLIDPGGFSAQSHGDRMRAAMVITGSTTDGLHLLLRAHSEKDSYLNTIRLAVVWAKQYGIRKFVVEQTAQQMVFLDKLRDELRKADSLASVEPITPKGKVKEARILELEPFFQQGRMYIGAGAEFLEFRQQFSQFPRAARRDLLDALAYGPYVWRKVATSSSTSHQKRQQEELERLRQRMAGTSGSLSYGRPL